ncbi:MAG: TolC family protein [Calditrichaeota bacterium]|nr:MAG: TolC family protein [Calditrichota bacterium]
MGIVRSFFKREASGLGAGVFRFSLLGALLLVLVGTGVNRAGGTLKYPFEDLYPPYSAKEIQEVLKRPLTLEDCIRIALSENVSLQIVEGDLYAAESDVSGSYGTFLPVLSLNASRTQSEENHPLDPTSPQDPTRLTFDNNALVAQFQQTLYSGTKLDFSFDLRRDVNSPSTFGDPKSKLETRNFSVTVTQPLLKGGWFTVTRSPITLSRYSHEAQKYRYTDTQLKTITDTKIAFYNVLLQREIIKSNLAAIKRDSTLIALSEAKVQASMATKRDVLSAQIQLAEDQASLIAAQADYQKALDDLKEIMGVPIDYPIEIDTVALSYSESPLDPKPLIEKALARNPNLHFFERNIAMKDLEYRVAQNERLPQLDLAFQYTGGSDNNLTQNSEVTSNDLVVSLNLSYPLFNKSAVAKAQKLRIAKTQEMLKLEDFRRQIVLQIRDIVRSIHTNVEEIKVLKQTIEAAKEKVQFATVMFNLGRASNFDITDAQQALLKAEIQLAGKLVNYHSQLAILESLVGEPISMVENEQ